MQNAALSTYTPAPQLRCFAMLDEAVARLRAENARRQPAAWRNLRQRYDALARLGCFYDQELCDLTAKGRGKVLHRLEMAVGRDERASNPRHHLHWTYELSRHRNLVGARDAERLALEALAERRRAAA